MTICLPTVSDAGLTARLSPHFGRAPFFTLVETETGNVEVVPNTHQHHEHGHCNPLGALGEVRDGELRLRAAYELPDGSFRRADACGPADDPTVVVSAAAAVLRSEGTGAA